VIALSVSLVPGQYLVSVDRQNWSLSAVLLATGATALGNHFALRGGHGLVGVAAATSAGYLAYLLLVAAPMWLDLDRAGRFRFLVLHLLAVGPTLLAAGLMEQLHPSTPGDWLGLVTKTLAVLIIWSATVALGWHLGGWREALRKRSP
jgi:hypothetical protein